MAVAGSDLKDWTDPAEASNRPIQLDSFLIGH